MNIFVFGSSLISTYWNGAATYYRGIYKNLYRLGHQITFAEPDVYGRQQKRDLDDVSYANVLVYQSPGELPRLLNQAGRADVVIKHSGVGAADELLEKEVLACGSRKTKVIFWDVDAPETLARVEAAVHDQFRELIPQYDVIFTYGGGPPIVQHYLQLGAKGCVPIYNAFDSDTHYPVARDPRLSCDLAFVGHRLPDRERRVEEFLFAAATLAPEMAFVLGGEGWGDKSMPENIRWIGHVGSDLHNSVNCSARMVLNINRNSMAAVGFSPPTRVFEAAGAGACVITDYWAGIETFFAPGSEILPAHSAREVVQLLRGLQSKEAQAIGAAMRRRAFREHTYELRAAQVDVELRCLFAAPVGNKPGTSLDLRPAPGYTPA